jgi:hypothetical protein
LFDRDLGTSCRHPVQIAIGDPDELASLRLVSNSISLGFCYLTLRQSARLSEMQARRLIQSGRRFRSRRAVSKSNSWIQAA